MKSKGKQRPVLRFIMVLAALIFVNVVFSRYFVRIDLTSEGRYSLTEPTKRLLEKLDDVVFIKVYLEGEFSSHFKRLRDETQYILEEFRYYSNGNIEFEFIDPSLGADTLEGSDLQKEIYKKGLRPVSDQSASASEISERVVFPGAIFRYKDKEIPLNFVSSQIGFDIAGNIDKAVAGLEFGLASSIRKLQSTKKRTIGFLASHGTLNPGEVYDLEKSISEFNNFVPLFLNDSVLFIPPKDIDVLIIGRPTLPFSERQKFVLDQYVMQGGKVIWLIDPVRASEDSLASGNAAFLATNYQLELEDLLFKYGARINPNLIQALECLPIPLTGQSGRLDYKDWYYYPLLQPASSNPIVKNLDRVMGRFVSTIDTVGQDSKIRKTILLRSSEKSRVVHSPARVSLALVRMPPEPGIFNQGPQNTAVLLEGEFESLFKYKLDPSFLKGLKELKMEYKGTSVPNKMIVISDGDIIRNALAQNPFEMQLGLYKWTKQIYANKDFIMNCIEYLTDETGIIAAKSKEVKIRPLDVNKVESDDVFWQFVNISGPMLMLLLFGLSYNFVRLRRYTGKV